MKKISIVIVARDAGKKIGRLLNSIQGLSDDVVVCDTGSKDDTMEIAATAGARVFRIPWEGYGRSKNVAISYARHDWILSLDSDEKIDAELYQQIQDCDLSDDHRIYQVRWKNYFGNQWVRHSDWGANWKNRLFNRRVASWDNAIAHEDLEASVSVHYVKLSGFLEHYSFSGRKEYAQKMIHSAKITALKYHRQQKQSSWLKIIFSPLFTFIKVWIFRQGFLDGRLGWLIARTTAQYTYIKYAELRSLNGQARYFRQLTPDSGHRVMKLREPRLEMRSRKLAMADHHS